MMSRVEVSKEISAYITANQLKDRVSGIQINPDAKLTKLQKLKAEIAFQNSQRQQGIYRPDTPPIVPRRSPVRPTPDRTKAATPPP